MEKPINETQPSFTDGKLTVDGDDLIHKEKKIRLSDVIAIKFGWKPIRLDMYRIGGRYVVELKTLDKKIKLDFPYYFGIFKKRQEDNFEKLTDAIWDITVVRLLNTMIEDINGGKSVRIDKCTVNVEGILYNDFLIRWEDLSYQKNYNRLTINSKSNTKVWTNLYYTEVDNVHVLMQYLEWKFEGD
ncbi:MAG TPA: hypothetical protein VFT90_14630 [Chryseosolibacter sp.]|nr:hypothetical protein [Chryseosolibacter sp.]